MSEQNDKLHHYCGVVGIYSKDKVNMPAKLFYPLFSMQHRGQESCGIAYHRHDHLIAYKDLGMVETVLSHYLQEDHPSHVGIGHARYSTHGANKLENAQPVLVSCNKGEIAVAHNGNISNAEALRQDLFKRGSIFQTTSDTEVVPHLISRSDEPEFEKSLISSLQKLKGAFSMVILHNDTLIAVRDPLGFRPLVLGEKEGITMVASETCAFDIMQINYVREIEPGEVVFINKEGIRSVRFADSPRKAQCIFELIYFARPDSRIFSYSVHKLRRAMGAHLAKIETENADIVSAVPDSGNSAAMGYAKYSGMDLEVSLTRNHYSGRTFIQPTQSAREFKVRVKLNPIKEAIQGKKLILIDDSLVRGTTSKLIVKLLQEGGAGEVHLRLSSPEIKYPCYFGIDIPTSKELISHSHTPEEIAEHVNADSLKFLPLSCLKECVDNPEDFCYACFSGEYPVSDEDIGKGGNFKKC